MGLAAVVSKQDRSLVQSWQDLIVELFGKCKNYHQCDSKERNMSQSSTFSSETFWSLGYQNLLFSSTAGDRKKARTREMFEIISEAKKGNEYSDRMAGSDRFGTDEEISSRRHAYQFRCWSCLEQGNNICFLPCKLTYVFLESSHRHKNIFPQSCKHHILYTIKSFINMFYFK